MILPHTFFTVAEDDDDDEDNDDSVRFNSPLRMEPDPRDRPSEESDDSLDAEEAERRRKRRSEEREHRHMQRERDLERRRELIAQSRRRDSRLDRSPARRSDRGSPLPGAGSPPISRRRLMENGRARKFEFVFEVSHAND